MDLLEKLPEFLKMSWSEISKVMVGVFLTGFMAIGWIRTYKHRAKEMVRRTKVEAELEIQKARSEIDQRLKDQEKEHSVKSADLYKQNAELTTAISSTQSELTATRNELQNFKSKIAELEAFDGKLWERELRTAPPMFVPPGQRRTRFISVANLKGGVGKTTVTANAGALLAKRGQNVLMVDLDFQGSLTRLCVNRVDLRHAVKKGETVKALMDRDSQSVGDWLTRVIRPVDQTPEGYGQLDFIPASDDLADVELREEARWFVRQHPDSRFNFRSIFHSPAVLERYDYVLYDCPPRLTMSTVNAWACADYLIIPIILDQQSVQAIPRTLDWLRRLKHVSHAQLMGIVANQVKYIGGNLVQQFQTALNQLPSFLQNNGFGMNGAFCEPVKMDSAVIGTAVGRGRIPAMDPRGEPLFKSLVNQIEKAAQR